MKLAPEVVSVPLAWIINNVIRTGHVPECWKTACVLPLHKKGEKDSVANYRPISILPSASKIMEEIVRQQFANYYERILPSTQYGFRPGLSTVHATGAADHDWRKAKLEGLSCGVLFFDLSAAFDTLDVDLLVNKLILYGANSVAAAWVHSYMTGRRQVVHFGGESSNMAEVNVGSPQGSVISPLLFLIMVADLEEWLTTGAALSFADDTTVYAIAKTKPEVRQMLQNAANDVLAFMQSARLAANPTKTKFIMFGRNSELPIRVGPVLVEESKEEVLLGFTINKSLTWKSHMDTLEKNLRQKIGVLKRLSWQLPRDVVCTMIQAIFTSKLLYGLPLVCDIRGGESDQNIKRLHTLHRRAMKAALRIDRTQHPPDSELLVRTKQRSVIQMTRASTGTLAGKCVPEHNSHPLLLGRVVEHVGGKCTRQSQNRVFPPQPVSDSIVAKLTEMWERLPQNIRTEKQESRRCRLIKKWAYSIQYPSYLINQ